MIKENFLKILKRIAIIFLIVVFSIAGIVACSDEDIMGNASAGLTDDTGIGTPNEPTFTFPRTHIWIYAPWVQWREKQFPVGWVTNVSWKDTNTLSKIWKQQIDGWKENDGKRWMIREEIIVKDTLEVETILFR